MTASGRLDALHRLLEDMIVSYSSLSAHPNPEAESKLRSLETALEEVQALAHNSGAAE
jgi:hypothetical protein